MYEVRGDCTQKFFHLINVKSTEIRFYIPLSDWIESKWISFWLQFNREIKPDFSWFNKNVKMIFLSMLWSINKIFFSTITRLWDCTAHKLRHSTSKTQSIFLQRINFTLRLLMWDLLDLITFEKRKFTSKRFCYIINCNKTHIWYFNETGFILLIYFSSLR